MPGFSSLTFAERPVSSDFEQYFVWLIAAARAGNRQGVRDILDYYPKAVDRTDKYGRTALMYAAENGFDSICSTLIYRKASVDIKARDEANDCDLTALFLAVKNNHLHVVKILLASKPSTSDVLHFAAVHGNLAIVQELIAYDGTLLNQRDALGKTALFIATENGDVNMVDYLIHQGADIECAVVHSSRPDYAPLTPRILACYLKLKMADHSALASKKFQHIENLLAKSGAMATLHPETILTLLNTLLDKIETSHAGCFNGITNFSKYNMLVKIRSWLEPRISNKTLKSENIQNRLLIMVSKICAESDRFYSMSRPDSLKEFRAWADWHCPYYQNNIKPYESAQAFEEDFKYIQSRIALPSLNGQKWNELVNQKQAPIVPLLIKNNIFHTPLRASEELFGPNEIVAALQSLFR